MAPSPDLWTALRITLAIVVPAALGLALTAWATREFRKRGVAPIAVRSLRVIITIAWVAAAAAGVYAAVGPLAFLSTLTFSALAAITLSLALQTTLQNIIAGFILLERRFLRLGDVIQLSGVKGSVVGIGLVEVVIRLDGGAMATISNANLLSGPLINYTSASRLSWEY